MVGPPRDIEWLAHLGTEREVGGGTAEEHVMSLFVKLLTTGFVAGDGHVLLPKVPEAKMHLLPDADAQRRRADDPLRHVPVLREPLEGIMSTSLGGNRWEE